MKLIILIFKILGFVLNIWTDTNKARVEKKKKLLKEATDGVKNNDPSAIIAALNTAHGM